MSAVTENGGETRQSLRTLLCSEERDFLIRNNGDKVNVGDLEGKFVGLYFSAHWCPPCRAFTPKLSEIYRELLDKGDFEIVFVSADEDEKAFGEYHQSMPWLALPFSDTETREKLDQIFDVNGIPTLVILDKEGRTLSTEGVDVIEDYGVKAYPFTAERFDELKAEEEAIRASQTVESLLASDERDFVIAHGGQRVPISELGGKTVCLYFSAHWCPPCRAFTPMLVEIYNELKQRGEDLEIVFISWDSDEEGFQEYFGSMPWLALPYKDQSQRVLSRYFQVEGIPTLVVLGPDGKTVHTSAVELIRDYGVRAYPFTEERLNVLKAEEEARHAAQTLESLLVSDERDFVIGHEGKKVPVSELVGKTIALYFSAHWCPPCRVFTPNLIKVYNELKERGEDFEIVFISSDKDQKAFEDYYGSMPWLALPLGDKVKKDLSRIFSVKGIPTLIVIGPDGKTVTTDARSIVSSHGAKAYPFTASRIRELEKEIEESVEKWPKEVTHSLHEHSLQLTRIEDYTCDECDENGSGWSFRCKKCDFDLHPGCALDDKQTVGKEQNQQEKEENQQETEAAHEDDKPAGVRCDGDVCYKV